MVYRENCLLDSFTITGSKEKEFREVISVMARNTMRLSRSIRGLEIFSIKSEEKQMDIDNNISGYIMSPEKPIKNGALIPAKLGRSTFEKQGNFNCLFDEAFRTTRIMIRDAQTGTVYFVSDSAINTFAQRIGVTAKKFRVPSQERDLFMARQMDAAEEATLIVRSFKGIGKIFAVMSGSFPDVKLTEITDVIDLLKAKNPYDMVFKEWTVSNFSVTARIAMPTLGEELEIEYPMKRKIIPCIELTTSDIGKSSFRARTCWELPGGELMYDKMSYTKEHRLMRGRETGLDTNEASDKILEMLDQFDEMPKRFKELDEKEIPIDMSDNPTEMTETFKSILNRSRINTIVGSHRAPTLRYAIQRRFDGKKKYTAADILWHVIDSSEEFKRNLPKEWKLDGETNRKYKEALSALPYTCFGGVIR